MHESLEDLNFNLLANDKFISQWMKFSGLAQSYLKESMTKETTFIQIMDDKLNYLILINESSILILFIHLVKLSYADDQPIETLYEILIDNRLKYYVANLYRLKGEALRFISSSQLNASVINPDKSHIKFFTESYAEICIHLFYFNAQTFLEIKNKSNSTILVFSTIELSKDLVKNLGYYVDLFGVSLKEEAIKQCAKNKIFGILSTLNQKLTLEILDENIKRLQSNPLILISLFSIQVPYFSELEVEFVQEFVDNLLAKKDRSFFEQIKNAANRQRRARDGHYIWAYHVPELISKIAAEFRYAHSLNEKVTQLGEFIELDLDPSSIVINPKTGGVDYNKGDLILAVDEHGQPRMIGQNQAGVVIGLKIDDLGLGFLAKRLLIIGDLSHESKGSISAKECIRINAAIHYAAKENIPIDWFPASYGVEISKEKGIENLDASASTAREIIKYAHIYKNKISINVIVNLTNIGAQSYWDALASILDDTKGIMIMTSTGSMALTGHKAWVVALKSFIHSLDIDQVAQETYPDGLKSLGGYSNVYGPNSEAMSYAPDLETACELLIRHHYYSYLPNNEKLAPLRYNRETRYPDSRSKSILIKEIGKIQKGFQADREAILEAIGDPDSPPSLRWWKDAKGIKLEGLERGTMAQEPHTIIQEMEIGSRPTMVIFPPCGPLTPADSHIIARAIYKAKGQLPILIIVHVTGFNSDPLSMQNFQLSSGALISQAIVENQGPITIANVGCLIGGTFVVFSKQLNPFLKIIAAEGARMQVVGGQIAAKIIFHHRILHKAKEDDRLSQLFESQVVENKDSALQKLDKVIHSTEGKNEVYEERLRQVILELEQQESVSYDAYHSTQRALEVGAIDAIVKPENLREGIIKLQEETIAEYFHFLKEAS
jgi:acetyl-CoA carboxylase carboxyltransferase component